MANHVITVETQQKIVDDLANRFRNIAVLAAQSRDEEDITGLEAAAKTMQINVESQALVSGQADWMRHEADKCRSMPARRTLASTAV